MSWDSLERPLRPQPTFLVETPDDTRRGSELDRVVMFRMRMRELGPRILVHAIPNAGRRDPRRARLEGIHAGAFDYLAAWDDGQIAFIEFKGFDIRGRPGKLSDAQVEWGNRMVDLGHHVACFFRPSSAATWLRKCGAPVGYGKGDEPRG